MKLSSLLSRVFLPIPVAFALLVLFTFVVVAIRQANGPASAPEPSLWLVIVLIAAAIQIFIGIGSIHLLRRKPLWTHALTGLGLGIMLSVFSGEISLFGTGPAEVDPDTTAKPEFELRVYLGMMGTTIPAMVIAYCLTWWRFTLVPHQKHRRRIMRNQKGRLTREEIANADLSDHQKAQIPQEKQSRKRRRRTG